jgi:hypothetical protein
MTAARAQAVVATGLARPDLIARWRRDPSVLRGYGLDPDTVDLDALWKFAGLALKIRHNPLHADFPLTFRLLKVAGLEIALFAAYATHRAGAPALPADVPAKAQALVDFIAAWRDGEDREHALLWDTVRHENALLRLREAQVADIAADKAPRPVAQSIPRVRGALALEEMRSDPAVLAALLGERTPDLARAKLDTRYAAYWRMGAAGDIEMLELDAFVFYLLTLIDGETSAAMLCRKVGATTRDLPVVLRGLRALGRRGIVTFRPG